MRKSGGLVHYMAVCRDCPWEAYSRNAQPIAAAHSKASGHTVWVELGFHYEYGPRPYEAGSRPSQ